MQQKFATADNTDPHNIGLRKILGIVFTQPVFKPHRQPETFILRHDDLELQNIMVDEDGNVNGIIEWDGAYAAPRCTDTAAIPKFLRKDWMP